MRSDADRPWSMQFFVDPATGSSSALVASRLRRRGGLSRSATRSLLSSVVTGSVTAAARALVERAVASGEVDHVIAHTLPGPNPSTGVLLSLDFEHVGDQEDPEVGVVWEWRWTRSSVG